MQVERQQPLVLAALVAAAAVALVFWFAFRPSAPPDNAATTGVPVVMRTPGGHLEVATVKARESFRRSDSKEFFGIDLGTTVSEIRVDVVYRFYIEMAREWPLGISTDGKTATVLAERLRPTLPVAFDTSTAEKYTASGWARFDKWENLVKLEQTLSPQLERRAHGYTDFAKEAGRQVVREFVTTWLIREQHWRRDPEYKVVVHFPGESSSAAGSSPKGSEP